MKLSHFVFGFLILAITSCSSSKSSVTEAQTKALDSMMQKPEFSIKSSWAQPQVTSAMNQLANVGLIPSGSSAGNIDISGITNYLKMQQDSVRAKLPFFGERHFGGGYNNNEGIEFEGLPNNLKIKKEKNAEYTMQFNIRDTNSPSETYQVYITIWPNLNTDITVTSAQRNPMRYQGKVQALE
ncbi:hypothetical protein GCM10007962_24810 [Yeosuana aromativorans]|uniref:DUF4251 domain-containing protein n=1 Tax=Yeosuana aromativorans TaxID=288019 RepID=A0A8J3FJL3_9FLAO|nr:DUF4251 domain-containing protein [Yeosuana aromativorans]GGK29617.1 hypothetical protein GCM10007962_24810 [Yeosuana aromativorans]